MEEAEINYHTIFQCCSPETWVGTSTSDGEELFVSHPRVVGTIEKLLQDNDCLAKFLHVVRAYNASWDDFADLLRPTVIQGILERCDIGL